MAKMWATRTESGYVCLTRRKPTVKINKEYSMWRERWYDTTVLSVRSSWEMCYAGFRRNTRIKLAKNKPTLVKIVRV